MSTLNNLLLAALIVVVAWQHNDIKDLKRNVADNTAIIISFAEDKMDAIQQQRSMINDNVPDRYKLTTEWANPQ